MAFIPHTEKDVADMLAAIGVQSIEQLFEEIPATLRVKSLSGVPPALTEMEIGRLMMARAKADGLPLSSAGGARSVPRSPSCLRP